MGRTITLTRDYNHLSDEQINRDINNYYDCLNKMIGNRTNDEISTKIVNDLTQTINNSQEKINNMSNKIKEEYEYKLNAKDIFIKSLQSQLLTMSEEQNIKVQNNNVYYNELLRKKDTHLLEIESYFQEQLRKKDIHLLEKERYFEERLKKKVDEYENSRKVDTSYSRGIEGEDNVLEILNYLFKNSHEVVNVSKQSHKGDFHLVNYKDQKCGMIEIKNWSSSVTTKEIDKFINDVKNNIEYSYGIMCSMKTGFSKTNGVFELRFIDNKPIVFLPNFNDYSKNGYKILTVVNNLCRKITELNLDTNTFEKNNKISSIVNKINKGLIKDKKQLHDYYNIALKSINDNISNINEILEIL